jgi:hypothetical protein
MFCRSSMRCCAIPYAEELCAAMNTSTMLLAQQNLPSECERPQSTLRASVIAGLYRILYGGPGAQPPAPLPVQIPSPANRRLRPPAIPRAARDARHMLATSRCSCIVLLAVAPNLFEHLRVDFKPAPRPTGRAARGYPSSSRTRCGFGNRGTPSEQRGHAPISGANVDK